MSAGRKGGGKAEIDIPDATPERIVINVAVRIRRVFAVIRVQPWHVHWLYFLDPLDYLSLQLELFVFDSERAGGVALRYGWVSFQCAPVETNH